MTTKRWDNDTRGTGIANAQPIAAPLRALLDAVHTPGWVTEDADAHLGPPLRRACEEPGSSWTWISAAQGEDGVYVIDLAHSPAYLSDVWREGVALLARIVEDSFHVRRVDDQTVEAATGMLPGDGDFATHGHTIRLRIR